MSTRNTKIDRDDLAKPFHGETAEKFPPIVSPTQLADLLRKSVKTIYAWIAQGRLDGSFRKRGKHCLIWRDRAIEILMNGKEWQ